MIIRDNISGSILNKIKIRDNQRLLNKYFTCRESKKYALKRMGCTLKRLILRHEKDRSFLAKISKIKAQPWFSEIYGFVR